ncbi:porphyromonas-type peptidyl-arginine deiminase superfamily [Stemphylium lycopersici]|uniref:Porphyromonas-type peptidyl-arginine deiminase superfamily n=1 Tax=Stemphylium lycopersici TaxID=183478 RepID=A0A364MS12_STELY|nr:porphyromonas-type peptidyl-arginine deiminase [Stemphylium lycopersici]RAQ99489.1 porphyromonas-type peptidyl-arginine deiminase superfamily [Stemphylium lycopersici]RAR01575.1 porphyromonas-type peptidyl-arginine deiminase superfamily [Stemphylium lycopersici]
MAPNRFVYPGAFSRHIATILGFPSTASLSDQLRGHAGSNIARLAASISDHEPVRIYAQPSDVSLAKDLVRRAFQKSVSSTRRNVDIIPLPTHHLWVRDTGPIYVRSTDAAEKKLRFAIDFIFTEWGHSDKESIERSPEFNPAELQESVDFAKNVLQSDKSACPVTRIESKLALGGGAVVVDGEGTLFATKSSILNDNGNPGLSKDEVEAELRHELGAEKIIWFPGKDGLDVTDVHIDAEFNFIRSGVHVVSRPHCSAPQAWWRIHSEILAILERTVDSQGRKFEIHVVDEPNPECLGDFLGNRDEAPATNYVNFYFVDGGVIYPQFGDVATDAAALELFKTLCPERVVKPIRVYALPVFRGVTHCATQQVIDVDVD